MADKLDAKLKKTIDEYVEADARGSSSAPAIKAEIAKLRKEIAIEKRKAAPLHPALKFGPIAQTVASMAAISLGMGALDGYVPRELEGFKVLFTRLTVGAMLALVVYTSVIWYGYTTALRAAADAKAKSGEKTDAEVKLALLLKTKPDRPDKWAHTRSHPSAFLTTQHAAPRIFPFPLGKTRPEAAVADELWWEGGTAPHVGHFNRPKLPPPPGPPDEETLVERVKLSLEIEAQRAKWARRIRSVQILSGIVVLYFVNTTAAMIALVYLIYTTLAREIEAMLAPPMDWSAVYAYINQISAKAARNQSAPKSDAVKKKIPPGGMAYIYDPLSASSEGRVGHGANIPVVGGPMPVLMSTTNHWYAGP